MQSISNITMFPSIWIFPRIVKIWARCSYSNIPKEYLNFKSTAVTETGNRFHIYLILITHALFLIFYLHSTNKPLNTLHTYYIILSIHYLPIWIRISISCLSLILLCIVFICKFISNSPQSLSNDPLLSLQLCLFSIHAGTKSKKKEMTGRRCSWQDRERISTITGDRYHVITGRRL